MSNLLPLIIQVEDLRAILGDSNLLIIAVCSKESYDAGHIPGSHWIKPSELISGIKPAVGKIPDEKQLSELFSRLGLSKNRHVIAYDDEGGGWAGRLVWTLDVIGHDNYSYLDGGLIAWRESGMPTEDVNQTSASSNYRAKVDKSLLVSLEHIQQTIGSPDTVVWDARAADEFGGTKVTALRNGHIPGAKNLDWLELMDKNNSLRLKPLNDISVRLSELGIDKSKTVITHCQTHHRSGLSYLVGKALGLNIAAYDGSWSEWGNHPSAPIEP